MIRDMVTMDEILSLYGYTAKHGFMVCPFHGDKDPSLKIYKGSKGWHCFGCGRGGSVIDFVKEHEGCDFRTAVHAIDSAMRMNLFPANEDPYKLEEQRQIQQWLDDFAEAVYAWCDTVRKCLEIQLREKMAAMKTARDKDVADRTADEWTLLLNFDEECQYLEYKIEKTDELREEVAAWRRKARRVLSA